MTGVVTVHGLWMRAGAMLPLQRRLERRGFVVQRFGYPTVRQSLATNARALADFIDRVPGDTVHLVAHSLGGVVIRAMLDQRIPARLGRVVLLGSPLRGSQVGARVTRLPGGRRIIGQALIDLNARGGFAEWPPAVPAGAIAGRVPFGSGWAVGGIFEPNDGTVSVAETRVPGLADHIVMRVAHFALPWARRVSDQTIHFFERGRFRHVSD
ncbi:MAG: alpha/beta fold hydrolase [Gammaproteobacteria bacterium]